MSTCQKFNNCSAPICPLDANHKQSRHLNGERVCAYLSEYSKPSRDALRHAIGDAMYIAIADAYPVVITTYGVLKRRLERSSQTPTRLKGAL